MSPKSHWVSLLFISFPQYGFHNTSLLKITMNVSKAFPACYINTKYSYCIDSSVRFCISKHAPLISAISIIIIKFISEPFCIWDHKELERTSYMTHLELIGFYVAAAVCIIFPPGLQWKHHRFVTIISDQSEANLQCFFSCTQIITIFTCNAC